MDTKKKMAVVTMTLVLLGIPIAIATASQYAWSPVRFTVPSNLQFQIEMPGYTQANISYPTHPGNETNEMWFNATSGNSKNVEPCRAPCSAGDSQDESAGTPILNFTYTGSIAEVNLTMRFNKSVAASLKVWANLTIGPGSGPDNGCTNYDEGLNSTVLSTTPFKFVNGTCPNNVSKVFLFANFTGVSGGTLYNTLNYTSEDYS